MSSNTPSHISTKIDHILDHLNNIWNLQLPRLYGSDAYQDANNTGTVARQCSSRIRYLCYRSESGINNAISEFEDEAKTIFSKWVFKPWQERGTLPSVPKDQSFLRRDIVGRGANYITLEMRECLLQKLSGILKDECYLAQESESYERTSSQSLSNPDPKSASLGISAESRPRTPSPSVQPELNQTDYEVETSPSKRRKRSNEVQIYKRSRTQLNPNTPTLTNKLITAYFGKSRSLADISSSSVRCEKNQANLAAVVPEPNSKGLQDAVTSFGTVNSSDPTVFSPASSYSSNSSSDAYVNGVKQDASPDYFPTQDANEYLADISFTTDLNAADSVIPQADFSFDLLRERSPFAHVDPLPTSIQFWLRWEIYRISQDTGMQVNLLYAAMESWRDSRRLTYEEFWQKVRVLCRTHNKPIPERSDVRSWMEKNDNYESPKGKTCYFSFNLEYIHVRGPSLWKLVLNPIKVDQGNRIHRRFGSDRHIFGSLNFFDKASLPRWVTQRRDFDAQKSFDAVVTWLATEVHCIAGRSWRSFYLEPGARRPTGEAPRQKLSLFAVNDVNLDDCSAQLSKRFADISFAQFINWHIPWHENRDSTDLKLFSRFGLGLSKTRSTVLLRPEQTRYLPAKDPDMNDGCALMSLGMGRAVWKCCGDGTADIPTAFQARFGGSKGLWVIDYRDSDALDTADDQWIQISDSQLKIKPHPRDRIDADESQRSFEVLRWSRPCVPGHLNIQLINILADRGVSRSTLQQIVLNDIEVYIEAARGAMKDPRLLQAWLQEYHGTDHLENPFLFENGLPEMREDEARYLVQSGFSAENCEYLRQRIVSLMTQRLNTYVEKLRIEVSHSTSTFCVPDPYGVLEETEVYMGFSRHWEDPRTGLKETTLNDIDVLVARNPAALASDIQKCRAVYKHELRYFKDVIVFPTKGRVPLASLLSGGDYDGDTVTVIWASELVDSFVNIEKPTLPTERQCGLTNVSKRLQNMATGPIVSDQDIDRFLTSCIRFNAEQNRLGMCTNEHEQLIYSGAKLTDHGAILLAALAGYLVDANKQGLVQSDEEWFRIKKTAQDGRKLLPIAYKHGEDLPRRRENGECANIIDYLKFDVAMKRKTNILIEFEALLPDAGQYDRELSAPYLREEDRIKTLSNIEGSEVKRTLDDLRGRLKHVYNMWQNMARNRGKEVDRTSRASDVRKISALIGEISPIESSCDIYRDFVREDACCNFGKSTVENAHSNKQSPKGSRWSLLRASAMYKMFHQKSITWWTVGDELGRIKARSMGPTRELTPAMHHILKPDNKFIKRITEGTSIIDQDGLE